MHSEHSDFWNIQEKRDVSQDINQHIGPAGRIWNYWPTRKKQVKRDKNKRPTEATGTIVMRVIYMIVLHKLNHLSHMASAIPIFGCTMVYTKISFVTRVWLTSNHICFYIVNCKQIFWPVRLGRVPQSSVHCSAFCGRTRRYKEWQAMANSNQFLRNPHRDTMNTSKR